MCSNLAVEDSGEFSSNKRVIIKCGRKMIFANGANFDLLPNLISVIEGKNILILILGGSEGIDDKIMDYVEKRTA